MAWAMERAERAALYIFLIGIGVAMSATAGPIAFPDAPRFLWQLIFCVGAALAILPTIFLVYEYRYVAGTKRLTPLIGMIVFGLGFLGCAAWYFWPKPGDKPMADQRDTNMHAVSKAAPTETGQRGPTLEATRSSKIDAAGATLPGDLPFQFAKADDNSLIDMPGIIVTKDDKGIIHVTPPSNTMRVFPPPTGEFSNFSAIDLINKTTETAADLRKLQSDFDREFFEPDRKWPDDKKARLIYDKYNNIFRDNLAKSSISIISEILSRIASVEIPAEEAHGSTIILHGILVGPNPALAAAAFLEAISRKTNGKMRL